MTGPPVAIEEPTPAGYPEGGSHLPRIPRKWRDDAIRVCLDLGYTVTGAQAWRLVKDFREWRREDVREFIEADFRKYVQRRGDILQVRTKPHHAWRVSS